MLVLSDLRVSVMPWRVWECWPIWVICLSLNKTTWLAYYALHLSHWKEYMHHSRAPTSPHSRTFSPVPEQCKNHPPTFQNIQNLFLPNAISSYLANKQKPRKKKLRISFFFFFWLIRIKCFSLILLKKDFQILQSQIITLAKSFKIMGHFKNKYGGITLVANRTWATKKVTDTGYFDKIFYTFDTNTNTIILLFWLLKCMTL